MEQHDPLDDLAWLAGQLCGVPTTFVALAGGDHAGQALCDHAVAQAGALLEVPDTGADPRFADPSLLAVCGSGRARFLAAAVLRCADGAPLGALCVADTQPRCLTAEQRRALVVLAEQGVAQLVLRQQRQQPAPLDHCLTQEWARHARRNESLATLAVGIEGGAAGAGDMVQRLVSETLRTADHVVPLEGMRLAALLPGCGLGTAMTAAQRVRQAVERHAWGDAPVTVSLGVAAMLPVPDGDPAQLRARAEHALQLAQRQGRNRVAAFSGW